MRALSRHAMLLGAIAMLFVAGFVWVIATQGPLAPVKVTVAQAKEARLERTLFGIATVEARRTHAIGPTAAGRITRVLIDQGDQVVARQLLAEMDPVDLGARRNAAAAAAARAGDLARAAEAALGEATSRARLAQASADRYADLRRRNFVSQEAADTRVHDAAAGRAAQESAASALAAAREEVRRAQADLAGTEKSRAHLRLISPIDGIVSARLAEPGSTVVAGQAVVQVVDPASLWLRVRIDQGRSAGLAVGLSAEITLRSRPSEVFKGRVERVDLVGDAVTEERIANVVFESPPRELSIGELAEVTLRLPPLEKVLVVPTAALTRQGATDGVWRPIEGSARFVPVVAGTASAQGLIDIRQGLAAGDAVIVHSARMLTQDARIKAVASLQSK